MKTIIAFLISFLGAFQIYGTEVTLEQARKVAVSFLQNNSNPRLKSTSPFDLKEAGDIFKRNFNANGFLKGAKVDQRAIYVFNIGEGRGFILVSGDDAAIPILGYSPSGSIDPEKTPQNVIKWLEGYRQQVQFIQVNHIEQTELIRNLWNGLSSQLKSTQRSVSPLVTTQWDQSPYVNDRCPYDYLYGELTVTGCPATAMAQIMKFWKYPSKGTGFHSYQHNRYGSLSANFGSTNYNWEAMPNQINSSNDAVATLMYHCGVAVEMDYNVAEEGGSGSYVIKDRLARYPDSQTVEYALPTYFGYATTIQGLSREDYQDDPWKKILETELDEGRPIQYAGYGQGGHTFVCDGYDDNEYFHINWGWGGYYDGYYLIDALTPGSGGIGSGAGSYNEDQQALIGIQPPEATQKYALELYNDVETDKSILSYGEGFTISTDILNNGTDDFNGDFCAAVFDGNDACIDIIEIKSDWNLSPGYHYTNGVNFTTEGMLSLLPGNYYVYIFNRPTGGSWDLINEDSSGTITSWYAEIEVVNDNKISLYSKIEILTPTIFAHDSLSVKLDISNFSTTDFKGTFDVSLYSLEGDYMAEVEEKINMGLPVNTHYLNGLTFSAANIDVEPGTYLLALLHKRAGNDYELTGSTADFINPIKIIVKEVPYEKDIYENNDSLVDAYSFTARYENNHLDINTKSSNIHVGNDVDFYAIGLENGYTYKMDIALFDSYYTGDETHYTMDGLFQYSLDGINWSDTFDDVMPSSISASGNQTLYCVVSPYFLGRTGTYLLDIKIERTVDTPNEKMYVPSFSIYPNPCKELLNISGSGELLNYSLFDLQGQLLQSRKVADHFQTIDTSDLISGTYFVEVKTRDKTYIQKIIKE